MVCKSPRKSFETRVEKQRSEKKTRDEKRRGEETKEEKKRGEKRREEKKREEKMTRRGAEERRRGPELPMHTGWRKSRQHPKGLPRRSPTLVLTGPCAA